MTTPYAETAVGSGPPDWLVDLADDLLSSEFVQHAIHKAMLAKVMRVVPASPAAPTDEPGVSHHTTDLILTQRPMPPGAGTDEGGTLHDVCTSFSLDVLGHHVGTWTVCHSEVTTTDQPATASVRLVLAHPTTSADSTSPSWLRTLRTEVVSADFVQRAVLDALIDALMRAVPEQPTDEPGVIRLGANVVLTSQPRKSMTDSTSESCHEHFLTVGGHQLYHWTVCTQTTHTGPTSPHAVHLEARHPLHSH